MAMLDDVKNVLRVSFTTHDAEITDLIAAARQDLLLSGVLPAKANSDTDVLIKRCILLYCKTHFGWDNPEAEKFENSYHSLKRHLTLSEEYTG